MTKREQATELRLQGKSYGEIMKVLDISSKGTLSYWFRDLELPVAARKRLQKNIEIAQEKGLFAFNEKRTRAIEEESEQIVKQARAEISSLSKRELMLIGASLYWGEGVKKSKSARYPSIKFSNSDPKMVEVFLCYLRDVLEVDDTKMRPGIIVHPNIDPEVALDFWAVLTMLQRETFWVSVAVSRASKHKRPINSLPYGTFHVRVSGRRLFCRIKGHIEGIAAAGGGIQGREIE